MGPQAVFLLGALREQFSWHFQLLEATCLCQLLVPASVFKVKTVTSLHLCLRHLVQSYPLSTALSVLLPSYKDPCDYIGATWVIRDSLSISRRLT